MADYKVIIVGAGMSGCAAGKTLIDGGLEDFVILEATGRIGGRVNTVNMSPESGDYIELGAQWLHGDQGNPLYDDLQSRHLIEYKGEFMNQCRSITGKKFFNSGGELIHDDMIKEAIKLSEELDYRIVQYWSPEDVSIEQFKSDQLQNMFGENCYTEQQMGQYMDILGWIDTVEQANDGYSEYDRSHLINDYLYDYCGGKDYSFTEGTFSIMESLFLPSVKEKVRLNTEILQIEWGHEYMTVKTLNGESYLAEHLIVTTSVGYLKANHHTLFDPMLPSDKLEAIEGLTYGVVEKSILYFHEPFWLKIQEETAENFEGFQFVSSKKDDDLSLKMAAIVGRDATWWKAVSGLQTMITNPNVLIVWLCGENAKEANKCSDSKFESAIITLLHHFTGITAPKPDKIIRTNWAEDKYFMGSYMSVTKDYSERFGTNMLTPLYNNAGKPSLLFAGEAYHHSLMSSLPGASETGKQQAEVILHDCFN